MLSSVICSRLSFGPRTSSKIKKERLDISYGCLILPYACPTSSFNLIYTVSLHLCFSSELFTFLSCPTFPTSSMSFCVVVAWLAGPWCLLSFAQVPSSLLEPRFLLILSVHQPCLTLYCLAIGH